MANDYKKRRPLFVAPEGVNYEGKTCAGLSVLTSSKFDSVVHALNLPHLAVVVKRVPASGLTSKALCLHSERMNMKFLKEFRNKIVAGGRKGGLSKSPKKSAGQLRRWEEHRAKSILKPCK